MDLDAALETAVRVARAAGEKIKAAFAGTADLGVENKGCVTDLVTLVDQETEKLIISELRKAFPESEFLSEEDNAESGVKETLTDNYTWVIDPIDGTCNFVHKNPFVSVSIALTHKKRSVVGVVFAPILDELWTAVRGKGAFLNGKKISASNAQRLDVALVGTNVGANREEAAVARVTDLMGEMMRKNVRSLRSYGGAAIEVCNVACSKTDAFYEYGLHAWDIAAAVVVVEEAGGVISSTEGDDPIDLCGRRVVAAATPQLRDAIVEIVKGRQLESEQ